MQNGTQTQHGDAPRQVVVGKGGGLLEGCHALLAFGVTGAARGPSSALLLQP